jgi:hypothetical protein
LIIVTVLAEPTAIVATAGPPTDPMALAANRTGLGSTRVDVGDRSRGRQPVDASAAADPPWRDDLLADDPDQAERRALAGSGMVDGECPADSEPLRLGDPDWVDGYRLLSRLGSGGMADVFYAVAPSGGCSRR